jgi:hypothetical protein
MSAIQKRQPQDVRAWVRLAAIELTEPIKKRFLLEIEAHYSEAVAVHQAEGLSELDACRVALSELGDPNEAAKRYRKQHLTIWEAEKIVRILKQSDFRFICGYSGLSLAYLFAFSQLKSYSLVLWGTFWLGNAIVSMISLAIVHRKSRRVGAIFLLRFAAWVLILSSILFVFGFGFGTAIVCIGFIFFLYNDLPIWLKLLHISDIWSEITFRNE